MNKEEIQKRLTELEGEEVFCQIDDEKYIGIISGADYYVGVTLQDKTNKNTYILCIQGRYSPTDHTYTSDGEYIHIYSEFIKMVDSGIFSSRKFRETFTIGDSPSAESCPFN